MRHDPLPAVRPPTGGCLPVECRRVNGCAAHRLGGPLVRHLTRIGRLSRRLRGAHERGTRRLGGHCRPSLPGCDCGRRNSPHGTRQLDVHGEGRGSPRGAQQGCADTGGPAAVRNCRRAAGRRRTCGPGRPAGRARTARPGGGTSRRAQPRVRSPGHQEHPVLPCARGELVRVLRRGLRARCRVVPGGCPRETAGRRRT